MLELPPLTNETEVACTTEASPVAEVAALELCSANVP
jgi:hypothetical protein